MLIEKINEIAEQFKDQFENSSGSVPEWFIADKLNEKPVSTVQKYVPLSCKEIKAIFIVERVYHVIKENSISGTNEIKSLCVDIIETLNSFDVIDLNIPEYMSTYQELINELETAGIISQTTKQKLMDLIVQQTVTVYGQSWSEINNISVDARSVGIARGAEP